MLSPSAIVPHTMLSPSLAACHRRAPDDVVAIGGVLAMPHTTFARPGIRLGQDDAARQAVVAPQDLAAPDRLRRHPVARLRIRVELRQAHGAERVEEPGALPQRVVARVLLRGVLENRLDQVRRQVRIGLQHQRDRPADDRRRHAGAAQAQIRLGAERDPARRAGAAPSSV